MGAGVLQRVLGKLAMVVPRGYTLRPWLHRRRGVRMGRNVWISQLVYLDDQHPEKIVIGDDVTIGLRCTILHGVTIGAGAVVVAGSVVTRNVPPGMLYGPPPRPATRAHHPPPDERQGGAVPQVPLRA